MFLKDLKTLGGEIYYKSSYFKELKEISVLKVCLELQNNISLYRSLTSFIISLYLVIIFWYCSKEIKDTL